MKFSAIQNDSYHINNGFTSAVSRQFILRITIQPFNYKQLLQYYFCLLFNWSVFPKMIIIIINNVLI